MGCPALHSAGLGDYTATERLSSEQGRAAARPSLSPLPPGQAPIADSAIAERVQNEIQSFDWMRYPEADRQRVAAIGHVLDTGRTIHPAPEDLPDLSFPRLRDETEAPEASLRSLLEKWSESE